MEVIRSGYPPGVADTEPVSAVVARIPLPAALARVRDRWDPGAALGVPPHVTVLYPFLTGSSLVRDVRRTLAGIVGEHDPFDVRFSRIGRFPTTVFLAPDPPSPFRNLTHAVTTAFPGYPPYGGAFDDVVPHLTICESADAPLELIAAQARKRLPFSHRVSILDVLVESDDGRWHSHWRLRLGVRP
jgi:2'-5' RNA ligase